MTEKLYNKLLEHEIQWLSYYGLREDREKLNENSDIYRDVRSIGYTKRKLDLMLRCSPGLLTANYKIGIDSKIEDIIQTQFPKEENKYSPIELFFILYPDNKMSIINRLIPDKIECKPFYVNKS